MTDDATKDVRASGTAQPETAGKPRLPLFYKSLAPLDPRKHANLRLKSKGDYGFARDSNMMPLLCIEFGMAQKSYPIVFTKNAPHLPMALAGFEQGKNPMVREDGGWTAGRYLPAYLRRYPFILVPISTESDKLALCLDEQSGLFEEGAEGLFFDGEKATEKTDGIITFCREFDRQMTLTQSFSARMADLGLLEETRIRVSQGGRNTELQGFMAISEKKLNALDAETFESLRPNGYLPVIYAHLMSLAGAQSVAAQNRGLAELANDA